MKLWVISDLQMEDGSGSDEFAGGEEPLREFLDSIPDKSLILLGDIFEYDTYGQAYGDLIELMMHKTFYYVAGNHDRHLLNSSFTSPWFMGVPVVEKLILGDTLFMHGHQFDTVTGNVTVGLSNLADWLADHISRNVNEVARDLEKWANSVGRYGDPVTMRNRAFDFIEHLVVDGKHLKRICLGHTHQAEIATRNNRFEYVNSGCWIQGHTDRTQIDVGI